jgi:hypothetical protein
MLVPLTDSTNPYAAMMLELIRIQRTRPTSGEAAAHVAQTPRQRPGIRAWLSGFRARRNRVAATAAG